MQECTKKLVETDAFNFHTNKFLNILKTDKLRLTYFALNDAKTANTKILIFVISAKSAFAL